MATLAVATTSTENPVGAGLAPARRDDSDNINHTIARRDDTDKTNIAFARRDEKITYIPINETERNNTGDREGRPDEYITNETERNEMGDREGRPNQYNGVEKESDRKGRPNDSDRKITIGEIVGAYKSLVFNKCLILAKERNEYLGKFWQRVYYENIIRDDEAFIKISEYIINNPAKWRDDKFYID